VVGGTDNAGNWQGGFHRRKKGIADHGSVNVSEGKASAGEAGHEWGTRPKNQNLSKPRAQNTSVEGEALKNMPRTRVAVKLAFGEPDRGQAKTEKAGRRRGSSQMRVRKFYG